MTNESALLELREFGAAFGERRVLNSVSFSLPWQGCTVLLGPSGTGKSTLLRTLAGFNQASPALDCWGVALYQGQPCNGLNRPAMVMQNSRLLISNVLENLVCNFPDRAKLTRLRQIERIAELLDATGHAGLMSSLGKKVVELGLRDQRIIAILRHVMSGSPLLMIDEPTVGLTQAEAEVLLKMVRDLSRTRSVLLVLHNLIEARQVADRAILLAGGGVVETQRAPDFFESPRSEVTRLFLATGSCPEAARDLAPEGEGDDGEESAVALVEASAVEEADAVSPFPSPLPSPSQAIAPVSPSTTQDAAQTPVLQGPDDCAYSAAVRSHLQTFLQTAGPGRSRPAPSVHRGPIGFLWLLPGSLAGTPWPGVVQNVRHDLDALHGVGITRLISLTEKPFDTALAAEFGIACLASPMPDMHPPTVEQALSLCLAIDRFLEAGEVVAVHCHAGLGRTGTVLAAYWMWRAGGTMTSVQALEDVRRIESRWVQSTQQVDFLEEFATVVMDIETKWKGSLNMELQ